jgi:tetratricopeptide (TPR) repeat protein
MSLRRLVVPLALVAAPLALAACAHHSPRASTPTSPTAIAPAGPVTPIANEDDYNAARAEYDALLLHAPERAPRRAALEAWLLKQLKEYVDRGHLEEAYEQLKQAATLWDPEELADKPKDEALRDGAVRIEQAFRKRGAHEEVLVALMLEMSLAPGDAGVRARYDEITNWLRAGGATESEAGTTLDGRGRVIDDLETVARLWPSPFVVDELTRLYFERHDAGIANDPLGLGRRRLRGNDLRALLQQGPRPSTAYDLARLYLRVSKPDEAVVKLAAIKTPQPGDEQIKKLIERWAGKQATPSDAINVAGLLAQGHDDADVAERVCVDATARFPQAPEPHLCAGQIAYARDQLVVAMREFEDARLLQPSSKEIWQQLARLWQQRLFLVTSNENLDVSQIEPQLKRVEAFHAAAAKQFPGETIHPSMADALFEVGRGYYNAGRMGKAMEYLERSQSIEPSATALEQMGQIKLKKGEAKDAIALFEKGIALPKSEKAMEVYWRAKLRGDLGNAYEAAGDAGAAETARKSAIADWDTLGQASLTTDGKAESGVERAKLWYQLGDRDQSLANFEAAIDAAPDHAGTYADVIAFLVPRGELDEALDAYHRALGRNEVTEYLKVYCSLWIVDLARRAKQPVDPLASSFLQSTDGGKWYDDLARWATNRETDQQLLSHVDTPAKRAESAYYRAMRAVEGGDNDTAKKLWKDVVDTDMMAFFEYDMAQMFLRLGSAPAHPLLKSKGTYKPPVNTPKPPEGSI